jgi:hypothetical protein
VRLELPAEVAAALPNLVVIGAMKAGTSAVHDLLALHPDVSMSRPKELNFFVGGDLPAAGEDAWHLGNWHRGPAWYAGHFDAAAAVRGESSPGYTSPGHPEVPDRMAALLPHARLVFLTRDPVERAVSQYLHHRREGTERREPADALLDPASQYVGRGLYAERLAPFLARYDRSRVLVLSQEELAGRCPDVLARLAAFAGLDPCPRWAAAGRPGPVPPRAGLLEPRLRRRLEELFAPDAARLAALLGT